LVSGEWKRTLDAGFGGTSYDGGGEPDVTAISAQAETEVPVPSAQDLVDAANASVERQEPTPEFRRLHEAFQRENASKQFADVKADKFGGR